MATKVWHIADKLLGDTPNRQTPTKSKVGLHARRAVRAGIVVEVPMPQSWQALANSLAPISEAPKKVARLTTAEKYRIADGIAYASVADTLDMMYDPRKLHKLSDAGVIILNVLDGEGLIIGRLDLSRKRSTYVPQKDDMDVTYILRHGVHAAFSSGSVQNIYTKMDEGRFFFLCGVKPAESEYEFSVETKSRDHFIREQAIQQALKHGNPEPVPNAHRRSNVPAPSTIEFCDIPQHFENLDKWGLSHSLKGADVLIKGKNDQILSIGKAFYGFEKPEHLRVSRTSNTGLSAVKWDSLQLHVSAAVAGATEENLGAVISRIYNQASGFAIKNLTPHRGYTTPIILVRPTLT